MSELRLDTLSITNFRSICGSIAIPLDAPIVLIHGANGAGKSSVMSALELTLTGRLTGLGYPEADVRDQIHRGTGGALLELTMSSTTASARLTERGVELEPALDAPDAPFLAERCYLQQIMLTRLLESYENREGQADSPLTRFVKELLRIDELDSLIDGLKSVGDKRNVKKLVPEYASAEQRLKDLDIRTHEQGNELKTLSRDIETAGMAAREAFASIGIGTGWDGSMAEAIDLRRSVQARDLEPELVRLTGQRREIRSAVARWEEIASTDIAKLSAAATARQSSARDALNAWWKDHGQQLEDVLSRLRRHLLALPSLSGSDPGDVFAQARQQGESRLTACTERLARDDAWLADRERLARSIEQSEARLKVVDADLTESAAGGGIEGLSQTLATLVAQIDDEMCPVCGRDFSEVSHEPLSVHVAGQVSRLTQEANRLQVLAKAKLEITADLRRADQEFKVAVAESLPQTERVQLRELEADLREALGELAPMAPGAGDGAALMRAVRSAERDLARADELDRSSLSLRDSMLTLSTELGQPVADSEAIAPVLSRLGTFVDARIARLELELSVRRTLISSVDRLADRDERRRSVKTSLEQTEENIRSLRAAVKELERRRDRMRVLRVSAVAKRTEIVQEVFGNSLNSLWRDLFVRLTPSEPFVPAFRIPDRAKDAVTAELHTVHRDGGEAGAPAAMLSAGNLNTAALTLFLALHLSAPKRLPWLLLDDPVQSMDEVHVSQFAALLRTLSKEHDRRIVIAVHEKPLFEYLSLELSPAFKGDALNTVELSRSFGDTVAEPTFHRYEDEPSITAA